jgi:hypothetical protein
MPPDAATMRGARSGLASHGVTTIVLSGAVLGHDRVRDGSGWSQNALGHGHPASSRTPSTRACGGGPSGPSALTTKLATWLLDETNSALTIRTRQLQSVARCPPRAYRPGRLPGVSQGSGPLGCFVSGPDSRLDAFSGSPFRTSLPSDAGCPTTGSRAVRPSRSSRTRDGPPHTSYAHSG